MAHHCLIATLTDDKRAFEDVRTGKTVATLEFPHSSPPDTYDREEVIVGEGKWSFVWQQIGTGQYRRYFVDFFSNPRQVVELKTNLPGLGLYNVAMPDGSFISIRGEVVSKPTGEVIAYKLSVYELRDGKAEELSDDPKANQYWRWVGVTLPQPPGSGGWYDPAMYIVGMPARFSESGHVLASGDNVPNFQPPYWEFSLVTQRWESLELPGSAHIGDLFYVGSHLFFQRDAQMPDANLFVQNGDGGWQDLGSYLVLARDGGRHLLLRSPGAGEGSLVVEITP